MADKSLPYFNSGLPVTERIADLISRMNLDEKIAQLYSVPWEVSISDENENFSPAKAEQYLKHGILHVGRPGLKKSPREAARFTNAVQKYLVEETRLGIPALFHEEALHGLMAQGATSFPQAIALGSTWDPHLVRRVFAVAAREMRARGSNYALTPDLDLVREPRWGRTEESFGEDPYLVSRMGVAAVLGLQSASVNIDNEHIIATVKHFTAHGQPQGGRNGAPVNVSMRELRENFLQPFRAAVVEGGVQSVMASYNEIDSIPSHCNRWLLHDLLRTEWGFAGFVTSDGWGIGQLDTVHHVAANKKEAAKLAIEAGVDSEILCPDSFQFLPQLVKSGQVKESIIDRALERVLRSKFNLGLFENPYTDPDAAEHIVGCPEHRQLALEAAHKSIILLKNTGNLLPLHVDKLKKIVVIGPNAAGLHLGGYSYEPTHSVTVLEGIRQKAGNDIEVLYHEGCHITKQPSDWRLWWQDEIGLVDPAEDDKLLDEAVEIARQADVAILVIGGNEGTCREGWDDNHLGDRDDLNLLGRQNELVLRIFETGTPVVVVLINGRPLTINDIADKVPAIIEAWYPGQEGGAAIADILFGNVNPGGKLSITFPRSVGQLPVYYNHKPSVNRHYLFAITEPLFPFGYGLSYTTFSYNNIRLSASNMHKNESVTVSVDITNTGTLAGDEIVQLYIRDRVSSVTRPVIELKDFRRIYFKAGETQIVQFTITPDKLSFFDVHMQQVVEPGEFDIMIGTSSVNYLKTILTVHA
ncbi:MAG TPA: glycoside hydrolase family 3 N-terminal domain-containing protein [bacterium]|nr:glycoside hydrolase family 3 N-terminal domain-containing protein [bacterium]HPN43329.1 glycoside hydrolase family 3 N-terminal domain-containing protein [bacterium]